MRSKTPNHLLSLLVFAFMAGAPRLYACEVRVAPFFWGTGGFVARPVNGNAIELVISRASNETRQTLYARSDGLVVQLLTSSLCTDPEGAPVECWVQVRGAEPGAWYWVNGQKNAAVAPFLCEDQMSRQWLSPDPGGVQTTRSIWGRGTLFVHDRQGLMGILPHVVDSGPSPGVTRFAGELFRDSLSSGGMGPELVVVPAGSFRMGCSATEAVCRAEELPAHDVTISEAFAVSTHEVTFDEWDACVLAGSCGRRPPDEGFGHGRRPVINVTLQDAQIYVRWLIAETGEVYYLPSEAQWEYVARAGSTGLYYNDGDESVLCSIANHADQSHSRLDRNELCSDGFGNETAPVGSFLPNAWGLYDTAGNVWELTSDCWHESYSGAPTDGSSWEQNCDDSMAVVARGGSFFSAPQDVRSARRGSLPQAEASPSAGFRVARRVSR